jgi:hypothetical protein
MAHNPAIADVRSTHSDDLLSARPVWGPFIGRAFRDIPQADTFDVLEAATAQPLASVVAASDEIVALDILSECAQSRRSMM